MAAGGCSCGLDWIGLVSVGVLVVGGGVQVLGNSTVQYIPNFLLAVIGEAR